MNNRDTRIREMIFPVALVQIVGKVQNAESLLKYKDMQITTAELDCVVLENGDDGVEAAVVLDFGREINGSLRCLNYMSEGCQHGNVHITLGESVAESLSEIGSKNATNDHSVRDFDLCLPNYSDITTGENGFRFACVRLRGKNVRLKIKSILAVHIYHELEYKGTFRCSNERLNEIFYTAAYTCHMCIQNYIVDGIKRDRLVWVGDMHPEILTIRSVFGNIAVVEETIRFVRNNTPLPNWMNGFPTYSIWWLIIVYDWYLYSGNLHFLEDNRSYVLGLTEQLLQHIHDDGDDELPWYFFDWPCHEKPQGQSGSRALMVVGLQACENLARLYEHEGLAESCAKKRKAMLSTKADSYGAKQVIAMLSLAGWHDEKKASQEILENGAKGWSTFMSYYLLKAAGRGDMNKTLSALEEYYGAMLDKGATTFWEDFDLSWVENASRIDEIVAEGKKDIHGDCGAYCYQGYRHSLCHGWSSGPTAFLMEEVLGIKIVEPGCKVIKIEPNLGDLEWVEGTYPTPCGVIRVRVERSQDGIVKKFIEAPREITII